MIFSVQGTIWGLLLLAPPLFILPIFSPTGLPKEIKPNVISIFVAVQIIGRSLCLLVLMFSYNSFFGIHISLFSDAMFFCLFFEYYLWIRYLYNGRYYAFLLEPLFYLPLPVLSLPLIAYLCAIIWTKNLPLAIAALLLFVADIFVCIKYRHLSSFIVYRSKDEEEDTP